MSENEKVTEVTVGEYNGYPVLRLPNGRRYGFSFGLKKASAVLVYAEAIEEFVETEGGRVSNPDCTIGEFHDHPVLSLPNGSRHGFSFGLSKAKLLLEHLDDIRSFVADLS